MRDALVVELNREAKRADGTLAKRLRLVARRLVDRAEEGEVSAIKEIFDRIDGRVPLAQHLSGPDGGPIDLIAEFIKTLGETTRGLPDPSRVPPDREMIDVTPLPASPTHAA
jgi:hypothetical protein